MDEPYDGLPPIVTLGQTAMDALRANGALPARYTSMEPKTIRLARNQAITITVDIVLTDDDLQAIVDAHRAESQQKTAHGD